MFLTCFLVPLAANGQGDTEAPVVESVTVSPSTLDVTSSEQAVTVSLRVTDVGMGVSFVSVWARTPSGGRLPTARATIPVSGDSNNGVYELELAVPRFTAPGTCQLEIFLGDRSGNYSSFGPDNAEIPGDQTFEVANTGPADTQGPEVVGVTVFPSPVDVTHSSQTVSLSIRVTDDVFGVESISVNLLTLAGNYLSGARDFSFSPTTGDRLDGIYELEFIVPRYVAPGNLTLQVYCEDRAGHQRDYGRYGAAIPGGGLIPVVNSGPADTSAPEIQSISVTPSPVDVTNGPQTVTISMRITDDLSGTALGNVYVSIYDPNGEYVSGAGLVSPDSGDGLDGIYSTKFDLPSGSQPGDWEIATTVSDSVGNETRYVSKPYELMLPAGATESIMVTNSGISDQAPPQLVSLSVSPGSADVTTEGKTVTFTIGISDDLAGFADGSFDLRTPEGDYYDYAYFDEDNRSGGDANAGTYQFSVDLPRYSTPGSYIIELSLSDTLGNEISYGQYGGPFPAGVSSTLEILNTGPEDIEAPELVSLSMSPASVEVSAAAGTVTLTLQATDDLSGLETDNFYVNLRSPEGDSLYIEYTDFVRIAGDASNGTFRTTLSVPRFLPPGAYQLELSLGDSARNSVYFDGGFYDLEFPPDIPSTITVQNSGAADATAPQLMSLSASSTSVDVTSGVQTITFTMQATDDASGVEYSGVTVNLEYADFTLISGSATNGTYQATVQIPRFMAPGSYEIAVYLEDLAGHYIHYSSNPEERVYPAPFDGTFQVINTNGQVPSVYAQWAQSGSPDGPLPPVASAPGDDADHDGVTNGVELVLGSSALRATGLPLWSVINPTTPGRALRFSVAAQWVVTVDGVWLVLSDGRPNAAPVRVTGQVSMNGRTWTNTLPQQNGLNMTVPLPASPTGNGFARLMIDAPLQ